MCAGIKQQSLSTRYKGKKLLAKAHKKHLFIIFTFEFYIQIATKHKHVFVSLYLNDYCKYK